MPWKNRKEKLQKEIKKQIEDRARGATYGSGVALESESTVPAFVIEDDKKQKRLKSQRCPFIGCFGWNHASSNSKECAYRNCKTKNELFAAIKKYLQATYPEQFGKCVGSNGHKNYEKELSPYKFPFIYFFRVLIPYER